MRLKNIASWTKTNNVQVENRTHFTDMISKLLQMGKKDAWIELRNREKKIHMR